MSVVENTAPGLTFRDLVWLALEETEWNTREARPRLLQRLLDDRQLFAGVIEEGLAIAIGACAREALKNDRARILGRAEFDQKVVSLVGRLTDWLEFPLPGGVRLRLATSEVVGDAASLYEKQSEDMGRKGRWLRKIKGLLPEGKCVGDVLSERDLTKLWNEVR